MKRIRYIACSILVAAQAHAFSTTLRMGLTAPATGQFNYPQGIDASFHTIDSSSAIQGQPNTFTSSNTFTSPASTVTITQDLNLSYVGALQCLATNSSGDVVGQACGGGGTSTLAVFNGTSGTPGVAVSSPTGGLNFLSSVFTVTLQGPSTAYVTPNVSSITLQGNAFNGNSQLTQTDSAGHLPTSVFGSGLIISTNSLQSGTTFYTSSGTAVNFNSSTTTVQTLLQVNGSGLSGTQVVGQLGGSSFNVLANGQIGLGTAVPGAAYGLDEQTGTANLAKGVVTSSVTASTVTLSGQLVFKDGSAQTTAAVAGAANLNISSGTPNADVTVTSPTLKVLFDSTTFKTSVQGNATSYVTVNFLGAGITNKLLATDANGVVISSTVSGAGGGPTLSADQTWTGSNQWTNATISTFTYGLQAGSMTIKNLSNTVLVANANGVVTSTTNATANTATTNDMAVYSAAGRIDGTSGGLTYSAGVIALNNGASENRLDITGTSSARVRLFSGANQMAIRNNSAQLEFNDNTASITPIKYKATDGVTFSTNVTANNGISMGSTKITSLANGTASSDAMAFGQSIIVQKVSSNITASSATASTAFKPSNIVKSIQPTSASNLVRITVSALLDSASTTLGNQCLYSLYKSSTTNLGSSQGFGFVTTEISSLTADTGERVTIVYEDSPATTSFVTYGVYFTDQGVNAGGGTCTFAISNQPSTIILEEVTPG